MNINNMIENKKSLIELWNNNIIFNGSLFNKGLKIQTLECSYPREIFTKYYNIKLNKIITCTNTISILYERLKQKIINAPISYIYLDTPYISLYNNNYKVEFLVEDLYGEMDTPILLNKNEIYKLIIYEKKIQIENTNDYSDIEL